MITVVNEKLCTQRPSHVLGYWFVLAALVISGCATVPTGKAKLELIDQLVAQQEFKRIQQLLSDIDTSDPEFEALVIRRRAIRPLIAQFEEYTVAHAKALQKQDMWPQALAVLQEAQDKLSNSAVLRQAENEFFAQRNQRLDTIRQQIGLLEGQIQADKSPLVDKIVAIHPTGIRTRWEYFQHQRKSKALADDLMNCGNQALQRQEFDLAEACFTMVRALSVDVDVSPHLALINEQREIAAQAAIAAAKVEQRQHQRLQQEKTAHLKEQYRQLAAAGWLVAAKQTLVELRLLVPDDKEVRGWATALQANIDEQVAQGIREGQALYSNGKLEEALTTWQIAAELDPDNAVLQGHIARAERFIQKLQRLNGEKI